MMDSEEKARKFEQIQSWLWYYINNPAGVNCFRVAMAKEMVKELKIPEPEIKFHIDRVETMWNIDKEKR
jgi:hypothetical protein